MSSKKYILENLKMRFGWGLVLLIVVALFAINVNASISYVDFYDTDDTSATNPQDEEVVPSYFLDGNYTFIATVAVETQNIANGTEANLTLWNSEKDYTFRTLVDSYGYAGFAIGLPYSAEGYNY